MPSDFDTLRRWYDANKFSKLLNDPYGIYWLKLKSVSRPKQLRMLCQRTGMNCEGISTRQLLSKVYAWGPDEKDIEKLIHEIYKEERAQRRINEDYIISQLYQMKIFDWGGLYRSSLERTIVDNYVKKIKSWDELNQAIENELHDSMRGYVQCSWYNHWISIIIEDIFKDHPAVLPSVGLVKKVDFFIHNFPFDLKVTYFPEEYMTQLRKQEGLRPELTELKTFCRKAKIWFDPHKPTKALFSELLAKVSEHPSSSAREFIAEFRARRAELVQRTLKTPMELKIWLYENQGPRRFDAANRFFLILVDINDLEESWKLKRNKTLLTERINPYLANIKEETTKDLKIEFEWSGERYETYADILFIVKD